MRTVAIIQARMGSTRLRGKVLEDLHGQPMLLRLLERVARIPALDRVVVATSDQPADDDLASLVRRHPVADLFRGPEEDVLARYYLAASRFNAEAVVRFTADCPLLCPSVSNPVLEAFSDPSESIDYASNTLRRTFPRGLDTEVFTFEALARAHREASNPAEREHVTPYIWHRPAEFRLRAVCQSPVGGGDRSHLRWTVDTAEDLALVRAVYADLYDRQAEFEYRDILAAFDRHPEWLLINQNVEQKSVAGC